MRIKNESPYDTRVLRRIVCWTYRWLASNYGVGHWWKLLTFYVLPAGVREPQMHAPSLLMRSAKLRGTEWIALTRQYHGAPADELLRIPGRGVSSDEVATYAFQLMMALYGQSVRGRFLPQLPKTFPTLVPLRTARPAAPKRDVVRERHARVLELERTWTRKIKLAQTKLKKLRQRRRYYEKQLARRPVSLDLEA